ncbi:unnamed protein product [Rhizoctonia solani]|uniref:Glutathione S-transferase n=1 Tax=Rhizoctonia solani TaxID=456999 RepID=A0A8H2XC30_9AGAM|nr:unnamed protein product [Rhizoctonia solani]
MSAGDSIKPYILFHAPGVGSTFPLALLRVFGVPHEVVPSFPPLLLQKALLRVFDVLHEVVACNYEETTVRKGPNYARLVEANPLAQFPTLITPEGYVMTEMVGIGLYLHDRFAKGTAWDIHTLSPTQQAAFYRWFIFIPANVYPLLTIIEFPSRDIHTLSPTQQAAFYRWFIFIPANVYPLLTIIEFPSRFLSIPSEFSADAKQVESFVKAGTSAKWEELWKMIEREMTGELKAGTFLLGTEHPTLLDILLSLVAHYTPHPRYSWFREHCPKLHKNVAETLQTDIIKDVFRENELDDFL